MLRTMCIFKNQTLGCGAVTVGCFLCTRASVLCWAWNWNLPGYHSSVLFGVFPLISPRFSPKKWQVGSIKARSPFVSIQSIKTNTHMMQCNFNMNWSKERFQVITLQGGFVVLLFLMARTLHLPTCNVMNVLLVQIAGLILLSQQKMFQ